MKSTSPSPSTVVPLPLATWLLVLLNCFYHHFLREQSWLESLPLALVEGAVCGLILWISTRLDLARVTLVYLALPYVFFIPGWFNTTTALLLSVIFIFSLWCTLRDTPSTHEKHITLQDLAAFLLILLWVNLSGAGAYGYQTPDWFMHNARLRDLTELSWPIRYGENQNLVYYVAYFLPSAIIGKISSLDIGMHSLFLWTALGMTLTLRWLSTLSQWRFSLGLVLIFILFGPLDILNVFALNLNTSTPLWNDLAKIPMNTDYLDFRTRYEIGFFLGNSVSNTFQLFWSPQQVIAGWLGIALLSFLFLKKRFSSTLFVYALLCLWSPLIMLALLPFVLLFMAWCLWYRQREIFTFQNSIGALSLGSIFLIFYMTGGTQSIPYETIFNKLNGYKHWDALAIFYVASWGLYGLVITSGWHRYTPAEKTWLVVLLLTLIILPTQIFGEFNDLLCRGSAPLMFLLLVFLLRNFTMAQQEKRHAQQMLLCVLLLLGSGSSLLQLYTAIERYGQQKPTATITNYAYASENLGADNSLFERWFRKPLP